MSPLVLLGVWTIYDHPLDFPDEFVARLHLVYAGGLTAPSAQHVTGASLDAVRAALPPGLERFPRSPGDDATIIESWL